MSSFLFFWNQGKIYIIETYRLYICKPTNSNNYVYPSIYYLNQDIGYGACEGYSKGKSAN